ncbi:hypothetical protein JF733_1147 [Escherichia coli]|nr:hypothetical protein JF733_1147 [Escherichia coli]
MTQPLVGKQILIVEDEQVFGFCLSLSQHV